MAGGNKPRNLLLPIDAKSDFIFEFDGRFRIHHKLVIKQCDDDETWPGGAVWDMGVVLAWIFVGLVEGSLIRMYMQGKPSLNGRSSLPQRVIDWTRILQPSCAILELGCGVGLTGLVAAIASQARLVVLTDLQEVIEKVTMPNVIINSSGSPETRYIDMTSRQCLCEQCVERFVNSDKSVFAADNDVMDKPKPLQQYKMYTIDKSKAKAVAIPLCWGNRQDEDNVRQVLSSFALSSSSSSSNGKKGPSKKKSQVVSAGPLSPCTCFPDLILIGDVAYQHRPGAPSHFDALLSTLLNVTNDTTIVIFSTRIRMPASVDLLNMLLEHFDELVDPVVSADEVVNTGDKESKDDKNTSYASKSKSKDKYSSAMMTVHFMRRRNR